jgi:hypothetical protein
VRISFGGRYSVGALEDALRRMADDLIANGVQEIAGLTIYLRPQANGRPIQFRNAAGESVEHLIIDAAENREFKPGSLVVERPESYALQSRSSGAAKAGAFGAAPVGPTVTTRDVARLKAKWALSSTEAGVLLASAPIRIDKLLREPDVRLCRRERDRLAVLAWIDSLLDDLLPASTDAAQWLRSSSAMQAFEGASPLEQLLAYDLKASSRMCSALCVLARAARTEGRTGVQVQKGFDAVVN